MGKQKLSLVKSEKKKLKINEKLKALKVQWKAEKELITKIRKLKEEIDVAKVEAERLERMGELDKVAEIRYGKIPQLEKEIAKEEKKLNKIQKETPILKEEVGEEDIAKVVSRWTGIPVSKMMEQEAEKLLRIEKELSKRVVGQEEAIKAVSNALRRSRAGLAEENRPIGSFIFLGPTGVGKQNLPKRWQNLCSMTRML